MKKLMILAVAMVAMAMGAKAEAGYTIDRFDNPQFPNHVLNQVDLGITPLSTSGPSFSVDGTAFGGGRTTTLTAAGANGLSSTIKMVTPDSVTINNDDGVTSTALFTWLPTFNANPILNQQDLERGGATHIFLDLVTTDVSNTFTITLWNGLTSFSSVPQNPGMAAPLTMSFALSDFTVGGININAVTRIDLFINNPAQGDLKLDNIRGGSTVPEPTSLALAGFAGIGMAVGAIRRRRQAKQAA